MTSRPPRASRFLVGALALAVAFVSSATCFAAVMQMRDAQKHACCAGMKQKCADAMAMQQDCCAVQSADLVTAVRAAQASVVPTDTGSIVIAREALAPEPAVTVDPDVPIPPSHPTYLLVSVFRL